LASPKPNQFWRFSVSEITLNTVLVLAARFNVAVIPSTFGRTAFTVKYKCSLSRLFHFQLINLFIPFQRQILDCTTKMGQETATEIGTDINTIEPRSNSIKPSLLEASHDIRGYPVNPEMDDFAVLAFRNFVFDICNQNGGGHGGSAIGMAAIGVALYKYIMRYNPSDPEWFDRDRLVLSNGELETLSCAGSR
jgi:hypothetical protein